MISTVFEALLASVFPAECQSCSRSLPQPQNGLCRGCREHLSEHRFSWQDAWHPAPIPGIRCAWSALNYRGPVKPFIRRVKFSHEFYLLKTLAELSLPIWNAILSETVYDALLPMPIDFPKRLNRRYNQTEVLISYLPVPRKTTVLKNSLRKQWGRRAQSGLTQEMRRWNLFGAFHVTRPSDIHNKKILLIDDMITTGATASEAARQLLKHGARQVDLFTLARSEKISSEKAGFEVNE